MTIHGFLLGIVIAVIIAAAFHLLRGGSLQRLGLHLLAANISFFTGHFLGELINWHLLRVGALNMFPAILAAFIGLILATSLAGEEITSNGPPKKRRQR